MKAAPTRSWQERQQGIAELLERRTGRGVTAWNARIRGQRFKDEDGLRTWLAREGVTGYPLTSRWSGRAARSRRWSRQAKTRVDLGLRLAKPKASRRLGLASNMRSSMVRPGLRSPRRMRWTTRSRPGCGGPTTRTPDSG